LIPYGRLISELLYQGKVVHVLNKRNLIEEVERVVSKQFNDITLLKIKLIGKDDFIKPKTTKYVPRHL